MIEYFRGSIDDVMIYNRTLAPEEVTQIYQFVQPSANCEILYCSETSVGIGTLNVPTGYKMAVKGKIIAEGVKVELQTKWPDHVFNESLCLRPLREVKSFIQANGHLLEIPSAKQVEVKIKK